MKKLLLLTITVVLFAFGCHPSAVMRPDTDAELERQKDEWARQEKRRDAASKKQDDDIDDLFVPTERQKALLAFHDMLLSGLAYELHLELIDGALKDGKITEEDAKKLKAEAEEVKRRQEDHEKRREGFASMLRRSQIHGAFDRGEITKAQRDEKLMEEQQRRIKEIHGAFKRGEITEVERELQLLRARQGF